MGQPEAKAPGALCYLCPLKHRPCVSGEGPAYAVAALVGEGPGQEEANQGRPFVGPSGKVADHGLKVGGFDREAMWITNATLCLPDAATKDADLPRAVECCRPRLLAELKAHGVERVLTAGAHATSALAGEKVAIRAAAGRRFTTPEGFEVMPLLHPAAILREGGAGLIDFQNDIRRFTSPKRELIQPTYKVAQTVDDAVYILDDLRHRAWWSYDNDGSMTPLQISIDLETTGLDPDTSEIIAMGLSCDDQTCYIIPTAHLYTDAVYRAFTRLVTYPGAELIAHNLKFERKMLARYGKVMTGQPLDVQITWDTMALSWALDERPGRHGLKDLVSTIFETDDYSSDLDDELAVLEERWKAESKAENAKLKVLQAGYDRLVSGGKLTPTQKKYGATLETFRDAITATKIRILDLNKRAPNYGDVQTETLYEYLAKDVCYTYALWQVLHDQAVKTGVDRVARQVVIPVQHIAADMERRGMYIDQMVRAEIGRELTASLADIQARLDVLTWPGFNFQSPKDVPDYLYTRRGYPAQGKKLSADEAALKGIQDWLITRNRDRDPVIDLILDARGLAKLQGTYVNGKDLQLGVDGRVHCDILVTGTVTGRPSFKRPNLGNLPRPVKGVPNIRSMYAAPPGRQILVTDYSQAELRWLAFLSQDKWMVDSYRAGMDLHTGVAKYLFGDDVEQSDDWENLRAVAKQFNFAATYNLFDPGSLAHLLVKNGLKFSYSEVAEFVSRYQQRVPGLYQWMQGVIATVQRQGWVQTHFGARRRFGLLTDQNRKAAYREAVNTMAQGPAAQLTWLAAIDVDREFRERGLDAQVVMMVYDSIVIEVRDEDLLPATEVALAGMVDAAKREIGTLVPFAADAKAGSSWGTAHKIALTKAEPEVKYAVA